MIKMNEETVLAWSRRSARAVMDTLNAASSEIEKLAEHWGSPVHELNPRARIVITVRQSGADASILVVNHRVEPARRVRGPEYSIGIYGTYEDELRVSIDNIPYTITTEQALIGFCARGITAALAKHAECVAKLDAHDKGEDE